MGFKKSYFSVYQIVVCIVLATISFYFLFATGFINPFVKNKISAKLISADYRHIEKAKALLKDGDLVLRTGDDFTSYSFKQFSQHDNTYSHCGLVRIEHGKVFVYHALGGADNPDEHLRKDSFEKFCDPRYNNRFGIYRYHFSTTTHHRLDSVIEHYYKQKIPFDMQFDLSTNDRFYCAEFVYKSLLAATRNIHYLSTSSIKGFKYVAIDNLFLTPHARLIYHYFFPDKF